MPRLLSKQVILAVAVAVYMLSLISPVFYTELRDMGEGNAQVEKGPIWYGWEILLFGWSAAFSSSRDWTIAWFANPLFIVSVVLCIKDRLASFFLACSGLVVALTSFSFFRNIWDDKEPPEVVVSGFGPGFYLWIASFVVLIYCAWVYSEEPN